MTNRIRIERLGSDEHGANLGRQLGLATVDRVRVMDDRDLVRVEGVVNTSLRLVEDRRLERSTDRWAR
jgi:hypothetical protein